MFYVRLIFILVGISGENHGPARSRDYHSGLYGFLCTMYLYSYKGY